MDTAHRSLPPMPENVWLHGLLMLVLLVLMKLAHTVLGICALVQFCWMLFAKERNEGLARFGRGLANWLKVAALFISGESDERPFPWSDWHPG